MAELLVMAKSKGDEPGHWKLGEVVGVQEDGHAWGTHESREAWIAAGNAAETFPGNHVVVKIPGLPADLLRRRKSDHVVDGVMVARSTLHVPGISALRRHARGHIEGSPDLVHHRATGKIFP